MRPLSIVTTPAAAEVSGPPVMLLHGFASRGRVDYPSADWAGPLSTLGRDVLVVDLPGHGSSGRLDAPLSTSQAVRMIAGIVADAGGSVDVVGYSLGARLAWDLAENPGIAVRRLVLGGLSPVEPFTHVDTGAARAALETGVAPSDPMTAMILSMTQLPGNDPTTLLHIVDGLAAEPFDPASRPPEQPVLVVGGIDDPMAQGLEQLAAGMPDATVLRVPGDHIGALHSVQFRAATIDFITH